jgi:hypothetical protein
VHFHFDKEGTFVNHFYYTLLVDPERAAFAREGLAALARLVNRVSRLAALLLVTWLRRTRTHPVNGYLASSR